MSCLDATFTLTPKSPFHNAGPSDQAWLACYGSTFFASSPWDFSSLYGADSIFYSYSMAADPTVNYSNWLNRMKVPRVELEAFLWQYGAGKSLALVFGFEASTTGRVLVVTDAGLIKDQTLAMGDNQCLLEIESLDSPIYLSFIHAGGDWFFKGLSGYVV
jgi:hypothetical protein